MSDNLANLDSLFSAAIEIESAEERAAYLDQCCGDDLEKRRRLEKLLDAHFRAGSFLGAPAAGQTTAADPEIVIEKPSTVIGPYKLKEQIGEGGFGLVFVAEQQEPVRRRVAFKIIKPGMDTREVIARFEAERQALALMEHPNIARVFDGGSTASGRPYFVMELVKGIPIVEYCDQQQLTARERLELFVVVCQAVQHAHGKGIIHRDLKPSNILVAPHDGVPVVKVIDFGIAKAIGQQLTEKSIYTRWTQMIGTPLYMSPEQAEINALDVDIRSDVYSLGVLLYELLTGTTPFDRERFAKAAYDEIRRIIREEEPPKPSTRLSKLGERLSKVSEQRKAAPAKLSALVKGDLDWIVMKALEKDRTRRYETASGLAKDVQRFLKDEAVEACPPSAWYRFRKMARGNRAAVTTVALVAATLLLGFVVSAWQAIRATRAEDAALSAAQKEKDAAQKEKQERERANDLAKVADEERRRALIEKKIADLHRHRAEGRLYASNIAFGQRAWDISNVSLLYHYLDQCPQEFCGWEHDYLYTLANQSLITLRGHTSGVVSVAFSPDGKRLASCSQMPGQMGSNKVKLWDADSGQVVLNLPHKLSVNCIAFSPDGKHLASASGDLFLRGAPGEVKLWDTASGKDLLTLKGDTGSVQSVAFSPDGKRLASAGGKWDLGGKDAVGSYAVILSDAASGRELLTLNGHTNVVYSVAFSPDGRRLATASRDKTVKLWELASGQGYLTLKGHTGTVLSVAFSPDGKRLASASQDKTVKVWDTASGKEVLTFNRHTDSVSSLAFSPDGKRLASASSDTTVKLWDVASGKEIQTFKGHTDTVESVAFSPDGKRIASASWDKTVKLWDAAGPQEALGVTIRELKGAMDVAAFSPDGKRLASASEENTVKLWDAASGKEVLTLNGHTRSVNSVAFSPDGKRLASGSDDKTVRLWDVASGKEIQTLKGHTATVASVAFSPDGKWLASASWDKTVKVWDVASGHPVLTLTGHTDSVVSVAFSPDGKRLASASWDNSVRLWDAASGQEVRILTGHTSRVESVAFSPDGEHLASASRDQTVKLWDPASGREPVVLQGHTSWVMSVVFSPDGKRLATLASAVRDGKNVSAKDGTVRLWDAASGQEVLTLQGHTSAKMGRSVAFSPDGKRLAAAAGDKDTIIIWDASKSMSDSSFDINRLGVALGAKNQLDVAIAAYRKAIHIDPTFADAYVNLGIALAAKNQLDEAIAAYRKAIAIDPETNTWDPRVYYNLANALRDKNQLDEAIAAYRKTIAISPNYPPAISRYYAPASYELGNALRAKNQLDEAIVAYRKAIDAYDMPLGRSRDPGLALAFYGLGTVLQDKNQLEDAIAAYRKAIDINPTVARFHNNLAWLLATCNNQHLRDSATALAAAKKAVELDPKNGVHWGTLGTAHYRSGEWEKAIEALGKAVTLKQGGTSSPFLFLAMAHRQLGRLDQARAWYDKGVQWMTQNRPKDDEMQRFRAEAAELLGMPVLNPLAKDAPVPKK